MSLSNTEAEPLLNQEREMNAYCNYHGIGLIPWSSLAGGILARPLDTETARTASDKGTPLVKKISDADRKIIMRTAEVAEKKGVSQAQVALAWVASRTVSPIIGVNSLQRLVEGITTDVKLTEEEVKYLEEEYVFTLSRRYRVLM